MLMNAVYVFLDGGMYVISRKSVVLRVQSSTCGHGGSHVYTCCWSPSHGDRNSGTSEKRWHLAITMTHKSCRARNPGKAARVRLDCQVS